MKTNHTLLKTSDPYGTKFESCNSRIKVFGKPFGFIKSIRLKIRATLNKIEKK